MSTSPDEALPELNLGTASPDAGAEVISPARDFRPVIRGKLDRFGHAMGTGRRKTSVARVRLSEGDGKFEVNGRLMEEYFPLEMQRVAILAPLRAVDKLGKLNIWVRVEGGGSTGQTGAVLLGIARALQAVNPDFHPILAEKGFLTRDSRMVERKKYGFKKARRSFQFSKR
jgi:small subunit ribosomal protein S9